VDAETFWIGFEGDTALDADAVEQTLLSRAAELAVQHGFTHFIVVQRQQGTGLGFVVRPGRIGPSRRTARSIHIRCFVGDPGDPDAVEARRLLGEGEPPPARLLSL
jgi:hypothetical protein